MEIHWGMLWQNSRRHLKAGWLITAGVIAIYLGAVEPMNRLRGIASSRETGLAAAAGWQPNAMWRRAPLMPGLFSDRGEGVIGGVPGGARTSAGYLDVSAVDALPASSVPQSAEPPERKTIVTTSLDLVVKNPQESSERIRALAEREGGFLVSAENFGAQENSSGSLTIRVPAMRVDEMRAEIRKLALRVESEKMEAQDVTKQYVDQAARLRNLHAQEAQYLGILRQSKTVKDTLEVSDKLNEVRGEIEQQQAEFEALSKQVETVALAISLRTEADMQVFGLQWRPLYQLKFAARQGLNGLADYAASMASFLFYLPTVLLWLATILFGAAVGWRILRRAGRALFMPRARAA